MFPLSPLRTPLTPSQKNKECNLSLGGTGGTLFTQHYSCPAVLRCYIGSCGRLSGYRFVWDKWLPQSRSPARAALNRQGGNIRVAAVLRIELFLSLVTVSSNVALVACKHAPVAQRADDSSSSSRRLAISLCPLRGHLKLSKTAPSVCLLKKMITLR